MLRCVEQVVVVDVRYELQLKAIGLL